MIGPNATFAHLCVIPEFARGFDRVNVGSLPPGSLVARSVNSAVMGAAQRDGKFIAGPSAEGPRLHMAEMMRIRWLATADKTWLLGDVAQMLAVAVSTWYSNREAALVDASRQIRFGGGGQGG
jgi:hypothetical protein